MVRSGLLRRSPASSSSLSFTHVTVNGLAVLAAAPRPVATVTEGTRAQFLPSSMLHVEAMHEDLDHVEALLAMLC